MSLNTTAATWVTGTVVTAAQLNLEVRDAINGIQAAWSTYTPALTASTANPTLGTGATQLGRYWQVGKSITCHGKIVFGASGSAAGTGTYQIRLPVAANIAAWNDRRIGLATILDVSTGNQATPFANLDPASGGFFTMAYLTALPASNAILVAAAAPWAWAAGDTLWWAVTYEAA